MKNSDKRIFHLFSVNVFTNIFITGVPFLSLNESKESFESLTKGGVEK